MARKSLQDRIQVFQSVHKGRYDYSLVTDDIKWDSRITVVCPDHGEWVTIVNNHQRGAGCPVCAGVAPVSTKDRIAAARIIHGDKYDYTQWPNKVTASTRVVSVCPVHGEWEHTIASHVNHEAGCPHCAGNATRDFAKFVKQATEIHKGVYGYRYQENVGNNDTVTICCSVHGDFQQTVTNHIAGKGCCKCAEYGFKRGKRGTLYLLRSSDGKYAKVGITNNKTSRLRQLKNNTPFEWSIVKHVSMDDGDLIFHLEKMFHSFFESANMKGFDGHTEWLVWNDDILKWFDLIGA